MSSSFKNKSYKNIHFCSSKEMNMYYFFKRVRTDRLNGEWIYSQENNSIARAVTSSIHAIQLKKYYLHLEEKGSSHWFIKKEAKRIYLNHKALNKKFITNFSNCFYCKYEMNLDIKSPLRKTIDHFIPLSRGGSGKKFNLRVACDRCNGLKSNIHPEEDLEQWAEFLKKINEIRAFKKK